MSIRVLLVDDEPDMRMLVRLTLERTEGIEVVAEVDSGAEAIDRLAEVPVDVVLLDYMMPGGLNGLETAEQVRASPPPFGVPRIVLFTAWATEELAEKAATIGIDRFLSKDDFSKVAATVREVATA